MLKRHVNIAEQGTSLRTEALAGITTFATMSYIIFVQPVVLGAAGMDAGSVFTSTCLITARDHSDGANGKLSGCGSSGDGPQLFLYLPGGAFHEGPLAYRLGL